MDVEQEFSIDWDDVGLDDMNNYCVFNEHNYKKINNAISLIENDNVRTLFEENSKDRTLLITNGEASLHKDYTSGFFVSATTAVFVVDCEKDMVLEVFSPRITEYDVVNHYCDENSSLKIPLVKGEFIMFNSNQLHKLHAKDGAKSILLNATVDIMSVANLFQKTINMQIKPSNMNP